MERPYITIRFATGAEIKLSKQDTEKLEGLGLFPLEVTQEQIEEALKLEVPAECQ